jgi:hypothetical protein
MAGGRCRATILPPILEENVKKDGAAKFYKQILS